MPRSPIRRQGVVYGPPRPQDDGAGSGSLIGRLLGLGIIVLAMTVLAAGALAFLNGPTATPRLTTPTPALSPSLPPSATFSPEASPTGPAGSATPVPSATTAIPSASPSPAAPQVQVGPGYVTFGTKTGPDVTIADPRTTFSESEKIRWSAYLSESANPDSLRVRILKLDPAAQNGERLISEAGVNASLKSVRRLGERIDPREALDGPGTYVVRYLRGDTVLSEGSFILEA